MVAKKPAQGSRGKKSSGKPTTDLETLDPLELQIQQEVEEFLRDLTLEFPFSEIFEILRRHEFKDRFGSKVTPLPRKGLTVEVLKEIEGRIEAFLKDMQKMFGSKYKDFIRESFKFYTETTIES